MVRRAEAGRVSPELLPSQWQGSRVVHEEVWVLGATSRKVPSPSGGTFN